MPHCAVTAPVPKRVSAPALSLADELQVAFSTYDYDPGNSAARERIISAARTLAGQVLALSKRDVDNANVRRALRVVRQLAASGVQDGPVATEDRVLIAAAPQLWPAAIAMMLLGAGWQWGTVPKFEAMPGWLWADYTTWLFRPPHRFTGAADAERYAAFLLPVLEQLAGLVERNAGWAPVRAAGNAYLSAPSGVPLYFADESLRRYSELRGRILKRLLARDATPDQPIALVRDGRRIPHILVYTDDPQHGGLAQYNHSLLLALARAGYRVTCVQPGASNPLLREQQAAGIAHRSMAYDPGAASARSQDDATDAALAFAADRPDLVVFSDHSVLSNLAARGEALRQRIPYITVIRSVAPQLGERFADQVPRLVAQHAAGRALVTVSHDDLGRLRTHFGLPANQGVVIPYGRPERFFMPRHEAVRARLRAELDLPADAVLCFTAARLAANKGHELQLAAAVRIATDPTLRHVYFAWAGDGDRRSVLVDALAHERLARRVFVLGQRWDVEAWYDAADIFALPSREAGVPLAVMEAMAKALPVVATTVSGMAEVVGDAGVLLPDADVDPQRVVDGLVGTIRHWAGSAIERQAAGDRCRQRAELLFREQRMVDAMLTLVAQSVAVA